MSLARLGHGRDAARAARESKDHYLRLNAALALGYLEEHANAPRFRNMLSEAATPIERVFITAALVMLGKNQPEDLHHELVAAAAETDYFKRVDVFFLHRYLQQAIIDALAANGRDNEFHDVWRSELNPLEPLASPVKSAVAEDKSTHSKKPSTSNEGSSSLPPLSTPSTLNVTTAGRAPLKIFLSYSHTDEKMRKRLGAHLAPMVTEHAIQIWHDRKIEAGSNWEKEINREIDEADLVLLLISASFLESPHCRNELIRALNRRKANNTTVIPIILRPCDWTSVFNSKDYMGQALPRDNRPVAGGKWANQDAAYTHIATELRTLVERLRKA